MMSHMIDDKTSVIEARKTRFQPGSQEEIFINSTIADEENSRSALSYIHHLQQRIQNNINLLSNHIPKISSNLYYNIQQLGAKTSVPTIISSTKNKIKDTSDCGFNANNQVTTLFHNSKAEVGRCVDEAIARTGELASQAGNLVRRATEVKNEVLGRIENCVKNNVGNEIGLALCFLAQVNPLEETISSLEEEVAVTVSIGQQTAQDVVIGLTKCLLAVENSTTEKSSNVIRGYDDCLYMKQFNGN